MSNASLPNSLPRLGVHTEGAPHVDSYRLGLSLPDFHRWPLVWAARSSYRRRPGLLWRMDIHCHYAAHIDFHSINIKR